VIQQIQIGSGGTAQREFIARRTRYQHTRFTPMMNLLVPPMFLQVITVGQIKFIQVSVKIPGQFMFDIQSSKIAVNQQCVNSATQKHTYGQLIMQYKCLNFVGQQFINLINIAWHKICGANDIKCIFSNCKI
tara:strand:+ start:1748 stop:2143 length:396 start_codon:yes stop_codon:yes gene_type:complete